MNKLQLVIMQSTPFCNIDCKYCYLPSRNIKSRMELQTIRKIFERIVDSGLIDDELSVAWHAGEPLVLPPCYYEEAIAEIRMLLPVGLPIRHTFQTNAILLNDDWCSFFADSGARVGVSIDGPPFLNDMYRIDRKGKATSSKVLNGIDLLKKRCIPFYILSVLTNEALEIPEKLYDFYETIGAKEICFNIDEKEGVNRSSSLVGQDVERRFELFLRRFWNRHIERRTIQYIREFDDAFRHLVSPESAQIQNALNIPFSILTFDCDGNFSTYSPELLGQSVPKYNNFILGNVFADALLSVYESDLFKLISSDIACGVETCKRSCEYFPVCGGGAPSNKYFENGDFRTTETQHCRLVKKIVSNVALDLIETAAVDELSLYGLVARS